MLINPVIYFLVVVLSLVDVKCQVCINTIVRRKTVMKNKFSVSRVCCDGYSKETGAKEISVETCKPICNSNCTNGYCKRPGECVCNAGYIQRDDTCVPYCEEECSHGACVAPNTCRCDPGYSLVHGTCQPVCTTPCVHGTCVSPDTCRCLPGYEKVNFKESHCKPVCSGGCVYGICKAPETCVCYSGWRKTDDKHENCSPVCKVACGNGSCVFPNVCSCFLGYRNSMLRNRGKADGPVCKPICKDCKGICLAPNKCEEVTETTIALATTSASRYSYNLEDNIPMTEAYFTFSTTEILLDGENSNFSLKKSTKYSWTQRREIILISIIIIVITGMIIIFIVWQQLPKKIINFFKSKSYNIQGGSLRRNANDSFVNIQFLSQFEVPTY